MKGMQKPMKKILSAAVVSLMTTGAAQAGSFSLYTESSGAAVGNYAAGIAAEAADASTGWYNPAGLALIRDQQMVFSGVGVFPSTKLTGTSSFRTTGVPPFNQSFSGLQGAKDAFVPAFHYALPLGESATFGFSMVSPFGLSTDWSRLDPTRYAATYSELTTTNISPEIGGKLTENFALGAGIDLQYARVKFNSVIGSPALLQAVGANPIFLDSYSYNKGDSFGVGFHAGGMLMFNENHTRIGLNYQSKMKHKFHGYSRLNGRLASVGLVNHNAFFVTDDLNSNDIEFPDVVTLSGYHDVNDKVALLGSVVYTGWNVLRTIQLNNVAASSGGIPARVNSISTEFYDNAWRAALGANYHVNDKLMLRVGGGYDQTPTNLANRDIRLPDADRWALSIGAHYQWRPDMGVDLGYTHIWADTSRINKTATSGATSTFTINATGDAYVDLVGAQLTWVIDQPVVAAGK